MQGNRKYKKIESFTDLHTWQEGHKLVISVYKETKKFPKDELFALTNQIRRAVVSVTSNIAEGFGRPTTKDRNHFFAMASGSLCEVKNQLLVARDVGYIKESVFYALYDQADTTHRLLNGLIKSNKDAHYQRPTSKL